MSFDLIKIYQHMGVFALGIAWTLAAMAVASLAVFIERTVVLSRSKAQSRAFARDAGALLETHQHEQLVDAADKARASHLARLVGQGVRTFLAKRARPHGKLGAVELTRRELGRASERLGAEIRRGFGVLATVGSVAPFVGLLGTVVGIIDSFAGIAKEGSGGLGAVSSGISEALVVTALGLLVAIPAVMMFNLLATRADALQLSLEQARGELVDHLENLTGERTLETPATAGGPALGRGAEDVRRA